MRFLQAIYSYFTFASFWRQNDVVWKFYCWFWIWNPKIPPAPNLSKIKPISWKICKFLHFSIPRHIHNKRLPWQHLKLMRIVTVCKMTPIAVRLNLKNFLLIPCAVLELLRKVSQHLFLGYLLYITFITHKNGEVWQCDYDVIFMCYKCDTA